MERHIRKTQKKTPYVFGIIVILIVGAVSYFIGKGKTPPISSNLTREVFCAPSDIEAKVELEGAAGSTYGALTLKNIGDKACYLVGDNFVDVRYDLRTIQNVTVMPQGKPQESLYQIEPQQVLYSQIRFPNGAQCNGETKTINAVYAYRMTNSAEVTFKNRDQEPNNALTICASSTKTKVDVWPLSPSQIQEEDN